MILSENALYIKYIRLKEAGDLPHEYPYTVPALAGFSGLRFRRPVTFIVGENGMGKSTLLEAIVFLINPLPKLLISPPLLRRIRPDKTITQKALSGALCRTTSYR